MIVDIDRFKSINDKYGHECGDRVLRGFTQTMLKKIRETDVLCRWGGEEFVILLGDCRLEDARRVVEGIREAVLASRIPCGGDDVTITFSAGVVEHRDPETLNQLVSRADKLLYQAKTEGCNRICVQA